MPPSPSSLASSSVPSLRQSYRLLVRSLPRHTLPPIRDLLLNNNPPSSSSQETPSTSQTQSPNASDQPGHDRSTAGRESETERRKHLASQFTSYILAQREWVALVGRYNPSFLSYPSASSSAGASTASPSGSRTGGAKQGGRRREDGAGRTKEGMDQAERVRLSARRVGLELPSSFSRGRDGGEGEGGEGKG